MIKQSGPFSTLPLVNKAFSIFRNLQACPSFPLSTPHAKACHGLGNCCVLNHPHALRFTSSKVLLAKQTCSTQLFNASPFQSFVKHEFLFHLTKTRLCPRGHFATALWGGGLLLYKEHRAPFSTRHKQTLAATICACASVVELSKIVLDHETVLTQTDASIALIVLSQVSPLSTKGPAPIIPADQLVALLSDVLLQQRTTSHTSEPNIENTRLILTNLTRAAWATASLGYHRVTASILRHVGKNIKTTNATPTDLATLLWAAAISNSSHKKILDPLLPIVQARVHAFDPANAGKALWSLTQMKLLDRQVVMPLLTKMLDALSAAGRLAATGSSSQAGGADLMAPAWLPWKNVSLIWWCCALLQHQDPASLNTLMDFTQCHIASLNAHEVATVMWSQAQLQLSSPALADRLMQRALTLLPLSCSHSLAGLVWAAAQQHSAKSDALAQALADYVVTQHDLSNASFQAVSQLCWGFVVMRQTRNRPLFGQLARHARTQLPRASPTALATVLWSLALARHRPKPLLAAAIDHLVTHLPATSAHSLSHIAWSLAVLNYPHPTFLTALLARVCSSPTLTALSPSSPPRPLTAPSTHPTGTAPPSPPLSPPPSTPSSPPAPHPTPVGPLSPKDLVMLSWSVAVLGVEEHYTAQQQLLQASCSAAPQSLTAGERSMLHDSYLALSRVAAARSGGNGAGNHVSSSSAGGNGADNHVSSSSAGGTQGGGVDLRVGATSVLFPSESSSQAPALLPASLHELWGAVWGARAVEVMARTRSHWRSHCERQRAGAADMAQEVYQVLVAGAGLHAQLAAASPDGLVIADVLCTLPPSAQHGSHLLAPRTSHTARHHTTDTPGAHSVASSATSTRTVAVQILGPDSFSWSYACDDELVWPSLRQMGGGSASPLCKEPASNGSSGAVESSTPVGLDTSKNGAAVGALGSDESPRCASGSDESSVRASGGDVSAVEVHELGMGVLRRGALKACGWEVVELSHHEWVRLAGWEEKVEYVRSKVAGAAALHC